MYIIPCEIGFFHMLIIKQSDCYIITLRYFIMIVRNISRLINREGYIMNGSESELLPYSTNDEAISEVVATLTTLFPGVGGIIGSLASGEVNKHRWARLIILLTDMESNIHNLDEDSKEYIRTEEYSSLFEDAIKKYFKEHREEKLLLLKTYILQMGKYTKDPYDEKQKILKILDDIQTSHIKVLLALDQEPNYNAQSYSGSVIGTLIRRLKTINEEIIISVINDLNDLRITNVQGLHTMITARGAEELRGMITPFGKIFLQYVTE
jgi:hypothetical protein